MKNKNWEGCIEFIDKIYPKAVQKAKEENKPLDKKQLFYTNPNVRKKLRFTPRKEVRDRITFSNDFQTEMICQKCCLLEDIEDKINFDFITMDLILENKKFYYKDRLHWNDPEAEDYQKIIYGQPFKDNSIFFGQDKMLFIDWGWDPIIKDFPYEDYGKWWAATKEELENAN